MSAKWIFGVVLAVFAITGGAVAWQLGHPPAPERVCPSLVPDTKRLDGIEARLRAIEDRRSMNLSPTNLYINVMPVENLGRHKP